MLIVMIVYLSIGAVITFGPAREALFELVKDESLAAKISHFAIWMTIAPVAFVYGFIKEMSH